MILPIFLAPTTFTLNVLNVYSHFNKTLDPLFST
jgi:hypothetical protein